MKKNKNTTSANTSYTLNAAQQLQAYQQMLLVRKFEEYCGRLYITGKIGGFCHLYIGQEAVVVGVMLAKQEGDSIITSYRDHGHAILSGIDPKYVLAELYGKASGCSKGKGGSMHMFNVKGNFYGGHGIVGAQVPIGTGIAFAERYLGTSNVTITFLGDGAINQGQVYEAFNMAALWKLPVVYIIENNEYAMGTSIVRSTKMTDLYRKGEIFDIHGKQVNGMDINAVYASVAEAVEFTRTNQYPCILEMKTYRYKGHSMSDPAKYRTRDEVDSYRTQQDPIRNLRDLMLKASVVIEDELKLVETKVENIIKQAVAFAEESAEPDPSELLKDVII